MRYLQVLFLLFALGFTGSASPLFAQSNAGDRTRCAILGPITDSARFGLLESANKGNRARNRNAVAALNIAMTVNTAIGCPEVERQATPDCVTGMPITGDISEGHG